MSQNVKNLLVSFIRLKTRKKLKIFVYVWFMILFRYLFLLPVLVSIFWLAMHLNKVKYPDQETTFTVVKHYLGHISGLNQKRYLINFIADKDEYIKYVWIFLDVLEAILYSFMKVLWHLYSL